jgi:pSer/pThr/pTyr-binding forkhead associated (FHA) protein
MAHLELYLAKENKKRKEELPTNGKYLIGRGSKATLRIDDLTVSREHCSIMITRLHVHLRDLTSTNGTFVNGKQAGRNYPSKTETSSR